MSKNQKGFALVEVFLLLIVLGILAGTGWFVWNSRNKTNKSLDGAAKTSASTKEPVKVAVNSPADWPIYKDTTNNFSFSYPSTWKVVPSSYSSQTVIITSPDIKEESMEPFSAGTSVKEGSRVTLIFRAQNGKTLDEIVSSSFPTYNGPALKKETRQIDSVPAYEFEYGYESPLARYTIFIKGSQYYTIGFLDAPDISKTSPGYNSFIKILDSVVVK